MNLYILKVSPYHINRSLLPKFHQRHITLIHPCWLLLPLTLIPWTWHSTGLMTSLTLYIVWWLLKAIYVWIPKLLVHVYQTDTNRQMLEIFLPEYQKKLGSQTEGLQCSLGHTPMTKRFKYGIFWQKIQFGNYPLPIWKPRWTSRKPIPSQVWICHCNCHIPRSTTEIAMYDPIKQPNTQYSQVSWL